MKNKRLRKILICLATALVMTALILAGVVNRLDQWIQDTVYQRAKSPDGQIVVIGIDDEALNRLGPYGTWDRHIMAKALEALNSDPGRKPAVTAIDTLYTGESEADADQHLADAAKELGDVVVASFAVLGDKIIENSDGSMAYDHYAVLSYEEPFEALKQVTSQGHINAQYDTDGIMRHAPLYIEPGERVYAMAYETAGIYMKKNGIDVKEPPTDARGRFFVSFSAEPGGYYDGYSIADLIEGKVDPGYYEGKIVLIGPYAVGLQDAYFTPIEPAEQMYGVEFQANVIQQVIDGNYKKEVPTGLQGLILFVISFLAIYFFTDRKPMYSGIACLVLTAVTIAAAVLLYRSGSVIHPLWIPLGLVVSYLISIGVHYFKAAAQRQQITRTFERYVAPEIVKDILKEGEESLSLGGKTCDIAVLFVDVRGFTTMSERLDPEKVVFILNRYLEMASDCVDRNHGTLDKFVGDAMMAFWGAPLSQDDAVYNPVKSAKEIVDGAQRVSDELKNDIGEELRVGVGVNYGPAVVGNMGAERHMDYTAIGDTVNTAARLEANAPGGTVYISRSVADELGDRISYTSLGDTIKLKGKAEGFEVLKLETII